MPMIEESALVTNNSQTKNVGVVEVYSIPKSERVVEQSIPVDKLPFNDLI